MNPIKQFFERRKKEKAFRRAGPGHKLADSSSSSKQNVARPSKEVTHQGSRHRPSEGAQRAGAAALARFEQNQSCPVNWSLAAVRAQARKELELEVQAAENAKRAPKEVICDSAPVLAVSGVYFTSPFTGAEILPKEEIAAKIKEFLYAQLAEERGLTSCLIIHTCNRNKEKVKVGVETLCRYLTNIIDNPTEEKFHKIRLNNKIFQERVSLLEGAHDFLMAAGFERTTLKNDETEEDFFIFPEDKLDQIDDLQMLKEALLSTEPVYPILDRNLRVLMPSQASVKINLPRDFFDLLPEEILKEQEARVETVELETTLRTKAMRERDKIRELRRYRYSLVRVRLPDGIILQGTFNVREKLSAIKDFIIENLAEPGREFQLLAPGGFRLVEDDSTLLDLGLAPAVILNLSWQHEDEKCTEEVAYLKPETMVLLQTL